jgi:hypothetical protein
MQTYVLNDTEVKLTGRKATRNAPGGKQQELVEVTPADEDNGTWKKWVPKSSLFEIQSS